MKGIRAIPITTLLLIGISSCITGNSQMKQELKQLKAENKEIKSQLDNCRSEQLDALETAKSVQLRASQKLDSMRRADYLRRIK